MIKPLTDRLAAIKAAIIAGDSARAMRHIEAFVKSASKSGIDKELRPAIEARIHELRDLAEASREGATKAHAQVQAIIRAAESLQTYDNSGRRQVRNTTAPPPRRY